MADTWTYTTHPPPMARQQPGEPPFPAPTYSGHDCSMMCDVCDMLRNIQSVVSDTNKMVKNIYHKIHREAPKTSPESNTK